MWSARVGVEPSASCELPANISQALRRRHRFRILPSSLKPPPCGAVLGSHTRTGGSGQCDCRRSRACPHNCRVPHATASLHVGLQVVLEVVLLKPHHSCGGSSHISSMTSLPCVITSCIPSLSLPHRAVVLLLHNSRTRVVEPSKYDSTGLCRNSTNASTWMASRWILTCLTLSAPMCLPPNSGHFRLYS